MSVERGREMNRRDFLRTGSLIVAGQAVAGQSLASNPPLRRILLRGELRDSPKARLAKRELAHAMKKLFPSTQIIANSEPSAVEAEALLLTLRIESAGWMEGEVYRIRATNRECIIAAADEQNLLYAVFDFIERQGVIFGIDGPTLPIDRPTQPVLPLRNQEWSASPTFFTRGLLPWADFWNCISVYNEEDFQTYFANLLRMRLNMFGMHVYTQNEPLAESYLSFDFTGVGHRAALEDTTVTSWGYLPQRTSTFKMGAEQFFDRETFGSDATRLAADNWERADRTRDLLRAALDYASELGIRTGIGFEPYVSPAEIMRALPPEAKSHPGGLVESTIGKDLLERRLANLLERYPNVDYVWLWEDEATNWDSRSKRIPLSVTPFLQAHDFLRRHASKKQLVLAGWGGIVRNFESLHERIPGDVIFSALSDSVGWDPVNEAFGKLGQRERWVIPWLEDDPAMWLPQFRASHIEDDLQRAHRFGCQGVLGIHWRHRIVDATASYLARAAWDEHLTASEHYHKFSAAQAAGGRGERLTQLFNECDEKRAIASTFLGGYDDHGFANKIELTPDYAEGFSYDMAQQPVPKLVWQRSTAQRFRQLAQDAASATEKERLEYFAQYVGLMVPYCDAYEAAQKLDAVLKEAVRLRADGRNDAARSIVLRDGVRLWLAIAPLVRESILDFQAIVATRNDQGQLASMHNKLARIALERLRLSLKEFLGELPAEVNQAYAAAIAPNDRMRSRVFLPTRPSILRAQTQLRLFVVVPTLGEVMEVGLHTRSPRVQNWTFRPASLAGRHVFHVEFGPFDGAEEIVEYYVSAMIQGEDKRHTDPVEAPNEVFYATLID